MNEPSSLFIVSILVVLIRGDKFLAMKRSREKKVAPGVWETLSGRLQAGEEPRAGLLREIKEESGLNVHLDPLPFDLYPTHYGDKPMLSIVYKAYYLSGEVQISEEHSEYKWVTFEEFESISPLKQLVQSIQKLKGKDLPQ